MNLKHNETRTRLYNIWKSMRRRCQESSNKRYARYGGRGIVVCEEWQDYLVFRDWALANGYNDTLSIDRIDNNGNYTPSNCRFSDVVTQNNNRSINHRIIFNGELYTIAELAKMFGLSWSTLLDRLSKGWPIEEALTTRPLGRRVSS
jgi:hypothetical protein